MELGKDIALPPAGELSVVDSRRFERKGGMNESSVAPHMKLEEVVFSLRGVARLIGWVSFKLDWTTDMYTVNSRALVALGTQRD